MNLWWPPEMNQSGEGDSIKDVTFKVTESEDANTAYD